MLSPAWVPYRPGAHDQALYRSADLPKPGCISHRVTWVSRLILHIHCTFSSRILFLEQKYNYLVYFAHIAAMSYTTSHIASISISHIYHMARGLFSFLDIVPRSILYISFISRVYCSSYCFISHNRSHIASIYRYHIYSTWYVVTCPHIAGEQYTAISKAVISL